MCGTIQDFIYRLVSNRVLEPKYKYKNQDVVHALLAKAQYRQDSFSQWSLIIVLVIRLISHPDNNKLTTGGAVCSTISHGHGLRSMQSKKVVESRRRDVFYFRFGTRAKVPGITCEHDKTTITWYTRSIHFSVHYSWPARTSLLA